jgi:hypothetical protein
MSTSRRWAPPVLDLVAIVVFVLIGRQNHGYSWNPTWFLTVWWPLTLSWGIGALLTRVYVRDDHPWLRLLGTLAFAVALDGPLRWGFTGRPMYSIFTVVAFLFLGLVTFGWRLIAVGVRQVQGGRGASPAGAIDR